MWFRLRILRWGDKSRLSGQAQFNYKSLKAEVEGRNVGQNDVMWGGPAVADFEDGGRGPCAKKQRPLQAANGPRFTVRKSTGTSALHLEGTEFFQQLEWAGKAFSSWASRREGNLHLKLDFWLVRPALNFFFWSFFF